MMDLPREGSAARRLYDYIAGKSDGATQDTMARDIGMKEQTVSIRLAELADKGLVVKDGKRMAGPDGQVGMDIWKVVRSEEPTTKAVPPKLTPQACPACGATVYQHLTERGTSIYVNTQKRLVVFDGPPELYDEHELPKKPLNVYDDFDGRLCFGREAEPDERTYFASNKKLNRPYTVGYEGHLRTCPRWDNWLSGAAHEKQHDMDLKWDRESSRLEFVKREPRSFARKPKGDEKAKGKKKVKQDQQEHPDVEATTGEPEEDSMGIPEE